jgi:hypothetical protein
MLLSGQRVVGLPPVDGMPHQSQRARSSNNSTAKGTQPLGRYRASLVLGRE